MHIKKVVNGLMSEDWKKKLGEIKKDLPEDGGVDNGQGNEKEEQQEGLDYERREKELYEKYGPAGTTYKFVDEKGEASFLREGQKSFIFELGHWVKDDEGPKKDFRFNTTGDDGKSRFFTEGDMREFIEAGKLERLESERELEERNVEEMLKLKKLNEEFGEDTEYEFNDGETSMLLRNPFWRAGHVKDSEFCVFFIKDSGGAHYFTESEMREFVKSGKMKRINSDENVVEVKTEKSSDIMASDHIIDFFVSQEVINEYHERTNIGEERERQAIEKFKQELEQRLSGVDLSDANTVRKTVEEFLNLQKNKKSALGKIVLKHKEKGGEFLRSLKRETGEQAKSPDQKQREWKEKPYREVIENYLIEKIIKENSGLVDIDRKTMREKLEGLVSAMEKEMESETPKGLDEDNLSFSSFEEETFFISDQLEKHKDLYEAAVSAIVEKEKISASEGEKETSEKNMEGPETIKEFRDKYSFEVFYVNKKDASDLTIIDYNTKRKEVTVLLSYKFKEEAPEEVPGEDDPTPVWSIEQRGGKKIISYEKFEDMMKEYKLESEFHKDEFKEERRNMSAKNVEKTRRKYVGPQGVELEVFKYKRGRRKGPNTRVPGTVGVRVGDGKIQYIGLIELEEMIKSGGFKPIDKSSKQLESAEDIRSIDGKSKKKSETGGTDVERLEFNEREKKILHIFGKFAVAWLDEIEKYDYEGNGCKRGQVEREKRKQTLKFWHEDLPKKLKEKKAFRSEKLAQKAIEEIRKEFEK